LTAYSQISRNEVSALAMFSVEVIASTTITPSSTMMNVELATSNPPAL